MFSLAIFAFVFASSQAFLFGGDDVYPDWDELKVTFPKYSSVPMTEHEAIEDDWTKTTDGCTGNLGYYGRRYVLKGDMATMLLFDTKGKVAGIQMAVTDKFTITRKGKYLREGDKYLITAYFGEPSSICDGSRKIKDGYVGDKLFLVMNNGTLEIPLKEDNIGSTMWTKGKCFYGMGQHYWYNVNKNMDCMDFAPFFLLYNGGELNGFGFAAFGDLQGTSRVEHPPQAAIRFFFEEKPICIENQPHLTTQHVYLQRRPYLNFC